MDKYKKVSSTPVPTADCIHPYGVCKTTAGSLPCCPYNNKKYICEDSKVGPKLCNTPPPKPAPTPGNQKYKCIQKGSKYGCEKAVGGTYSTHDACTVTCGKTAPPTPAPGPPSPSPGPMPTIPPFQETWPKPPFLGKKNLYNISNSCGNAYYDCWKEVNNSEEKMLDCIDQSQKCKPSEVDIIEHYGLCNSAFPAIMTEDCKQPGDIYAGRMPQEDYPDLKKQVGMKCVGADLAYQGESLSDAVEWCKDANHCCIDNSENPYMNDDRVWTTTSDTAPIEMQKDNSYGAITIYK